MLINGPSDNADDLNDEMLFGGKEDNNDASQGQNSQLEIPSDGYHAVSEPIKILQQKSFAFSSSHVPNSFMKHAFSQKRTASSLPEENFSSSPNYTPLNAAKKKSTKIFIPPHLLNNNEEDLPSRKKFNPYE